MSADPSSGVTPLEAMARALFHFENDEIWGGKVHPVEPEADYELEPFRRAAVAVLSAAIEALPEWLDDLADAYGAEQPSVRRSALRRAFGLGDQP